MEYGGIKEVRVDAKLQIDRLEYVGVIRSRRNLVGDFPNFSTSLVLQTKKKRAEI